MRSRAPKVGTNSAPLRHGVGTECMHGRGPLSRVRKQPGRWNLKPLGVRCRRNDDRVSTADLSLIVAGLAVVVGPAVTYWLGVRRFDHERRQDAAKFAHERRITDLADVRSALSGGALALHMAKETMRDNLTEFDQPLSSGEDWPDDFGERIRELERRRDEIEAALAALQIRLVEAEPVVVALSEAWKTLRSLISLYTIAYGRRGPTGASAR
jgi:hypothetical protein